ncbi:MAG: hypothetical protein ACR2RL_07430 [Gammaproteobacteria bacterium]
MNRLFVTVLATCLMSACSDESTQDEPGQGASQERGDHLLKDQVKAIDKVKEVNQMLERAAQRQRDAAQEQ